MKGALILVFPNLKIIVPTVLLVLVGLNPSLAQDIEEAFRLINGRQLDSAIVIGKQVLQKDPSNPSAYFAIGRSQLRKGNISDAIENLNKSLSFPNVPSHVLAWTQHDLAIGYYHIGRYGDAQRALTESLELKATPNAIASANHLFALLGFSDVYVNWSVKESEHFVFHFQNHPNESVDQFVLEKEAAFKKINSFFLTRLPKKIDYYVWSEPSKAEKVLKRPLAFTEPSSCLTHTTARNTVGHEITHSISHHAVQLKKKHKLISEGVCVYFDLTGRDNIATIRKYTDRLVLKDIWSDVRHADELVYPLGAELVKRLIKAHGREKFLLLLEDQTYESAKRIYGDNLLKIIEGIERDVNN